MPNYLLSNISRGQRPTSPGPHNPPKAPHSPLFSTPDRASDSTYPSSPKSEHSEHNENASFFKEPPETFIQNFLSYDLRNESIFDHLDDEDFNGEVCVLRDENTLYTMVPTFGSLDHDHLANEEDCDSSTCFCRLDYKKKESKVDYSVKFEGIICHFIRLGWMVEQDIRTKSRLTTNYVLLLNVTTKPESLWLAFDYVWFDDMGNNQLRTLGDNYNDARFFAWYYERPSLLNDDSSSSEYDPSLDKLRSSDEDGGGFLEIREPFDLAMMSRDIREDWKGRVLAGLERVKVQACMNESSCVLGNTLRAVPSKPHGHSEP